MNRYPRKQLTLGNINISPLLTGRELGYTESTEELTQIVGKFNYKNALVNLARINLFFQRIEDLSDEEILKQAFCSDFWLATIDSLSRLRGRPIFNRQSTLHLLTECAHVSDQHSTYTLERRDARNDLAKCYLIANGMLDDGSSGSNTMSGEELSKEIIADTITTVDYAINTSPGYRTKLLMVRSAEFLRRLAETEEACLGVDANQTFLQATGLTLQDYQHLVFSIFAVYWNYSLQEIVRQDPFMDRSLFFDPNSVPDLAPLYENFLPHTCISIDELKEKAENSPSFKNEFRLWRQYPLVQISEDQILCVDFYFLLEKLQTGVFWIMRNQLEKQRRGNGQKIIALWGDIFENYAASIIKRGIDAQAPRVEKYIIAPNYDQRQEEECTDVAICGSDTLVLLECKAPILRADTKFSGDFDKLYAELKDKIIEGERPEKVRGIKQLCNAIQSLFHADETQRQSVEGIDISRIKKIYPVLVLSDRIFSVPCMNWFLDLEYKRLLADIHQMENLDIMPLTVLTIEDLESLEPFLSHTLFHVHLDEWMQWQASGNDRLPFSAYLHSILRENPPQNTFYDQKFNEIHADIMTYFTERGVE
ncbi:hypothetical protein F4054_23430 [Candidatus Poribacteria bacterium]|nr:hypothetical protein [Candidatus Poribacteria bacterium]MYG05462.1 hypothetical protein [Candidatus Poribacteria bacterium]MYK25205.1 hypothetical protein [Candidatus Poribacteria bacterium]